MFCSHCGKEIGDTANFCRYCGTSTKPIKKICSKCGHENAGDAIYCEECGERIEGKEPPATISNERDVSGTTATKASNKHIRDKLQKAFSITLMIITIVFFVVTIGLSFGRYAVQYTISSSSSLSADAISTKMDFSYLINMVKSLKDLPTGGSIAVQVENIASKASILSAFIVAIVGIAAVIAISIIGIVKESINLSKGKYLQNSKLLLASIIIFIAFSSYLASMGINTTVLGTTYSRYSLGYSPLIVIIFGSVLLLSRLAYWIAFSFQKDKIRLFVSDLLMTASAIVGIIMIVFLSGDYASVVTPFSGIMGNVVVGGGTIAVYQLEMSALANSINSSSSVSVINKLIVVYNTFFFLASAIMMAIASLLYCFLQDVHKRQRSLSLIVLPSVAAFLSLCLMIFVPIEGAIVKSIDEEITFLNSIGAGNIAVFVLALVLLGFGIASFVLRKRKTGEESAR